MMMETQLSTQKIVKGAFWLYIASGAALFLNFLSSILLARMLDKELWGVLSVCLTVASFLTSISDIGLNSTITYYSSRFSRKGLYGTLKHYLNVLVKYKMIIIFALSAFIFVFADPMSDFFHIQGGGIYFRITAAFFLISNVFTFIDQILVGLQWFKESTVTSVLNNLLKLMMSAALVFLGFGVNGAIVGYTIALVIATAIQTYMLRKIITHKEAKGGPIDIKEMFTFGLYIGVAQVALTLSLWTDSIMIGFMLGSIQVGIYKIALSMASYAALIIGIVNRVNFSVFVVHKKDSAEDFAKVMLYGGAFALPMMAGLSMLSPDIIRIFYGEQYIDSAMPLALLSYIIFDGLVFGALVSLFTAHKQTKAVGVSSFAGYVMNVLMNLFMIPLFGILGAAIASVLSRIGGLIVLLLNRKDIGLSVRFLGAFTKPLIGTIVMAIAIFALKSAVRIDNIFVLGIAIAFGVLVYFITELAIGFNLLSFAEKVLKILRTEKVII